MSGLYAFSSLICLIALPIAGVMALWRARRHKAKWLFFTALAGLVLSTWQFTRALDGEARQAGFRDADEKSAFQKSGASDLAIWRAEIAEEKARAEDLAAASKARADAEADAQAQERKRLIAEADRKNAEEAAAAKQAETAACKGDLQCWGDQHLLEATAACRPAIERLARIDYQWIDGILETKLSRFAWDSKSKGTLVYFGDAIQFQNGFGNWVRHSYSCKYDPASNKITAVDAKEGRL